MLHTFLVFPRVWLHTSECIYSMRKERPTKRVIEKSYKRYNLENGFHKPLYKKKKKKLYNEWILGGSYTELVYAFLLQLDKCMFLNS